ncbi:MAG TPA: aromatic ring-hydroxylating dioxygenase subunit alpha [Stellaceae bacterium]|nr:aromatic ring-hydroxylating dioxygenase subunit alpha [Stellaceae bacterium]
MDPRDKPGGDKRRGLDGAPLREAWYYALPGHALRRGRTLAKIMLGEPVLLGRDRDGVVFALRDLCPHRAMPLSFGRFDGREIECCYHGWRFGTDGVCTAIPALVEGQKLTLSRIATRHYPAREVSGNIWVYFGDNPDAAPAIPAIEGFGGDTSPQVAESVRFDAAYDHAVIGLMDPAHVPFVHRSWFWRTGRAFAEKEKRFAPSPHGFTMERHQTSGNSRAYKLLGGGPMATDIAFALPGVRIEHTSVGRHTLVNMTAMTPIDDKTVELNNCLYWTMPWLAPLKPVLLPFIRMFLGQDKDALGRQTEGLKYDPQLMLVGDADLQARWYYRLKREYLAARAENRPFVNPVETRTLRWRS